MPRSSKWSLSLRSPHQNPVCTYAPLLFPIRATCPNPVILYLIIFTMFGKEYRLWSFSVRNLSSLFCYSVARRSNSSTLRPNNLSPCSSLVVRNKVSYPCKTTSRIVFLCVLIFIFWDKNVKDKIFWTWMVESIRRVQSALIFLMNKILILWGFPQIFEPWHTVKGFIPVSVLWFCPTSCSETWVCGFLSTCFCSSFLTKDH